MKPFRFIVILVIVCFFGFSQAGCTSISASKIKLSGLKFRLPKIKGGDLSEACGEACVEGAARGCVDAGCHEMTAAFFAEMFQDRGWRYSPRPYEDRDGILVRSESGDDVGANINFSYIMVSRPVGEADMSAVGLSGVMSMPSGFVMSAVYLFADEETAGTDQLYYNYFRFGLGHHMVKDSNLFFTLGLNFVLLDAEEGEFPEDVTEDDDSIGIGAEIMLKSFFRKPLGLFISVAPATCHSGTLIDAEGGLGIFNGPFQFRLGYRYLGWDNGEIQGPFLGAGVWF